MTYNELDEVIKDSTKADWLFNDERGIYTFKNDLNLRIQRKEIDFDFDKFGGEDWATRHPDPTAYRETYEIYYGSSFVKEKLLVSVDGHRATLPLPKINTNIVSYEDYHFAEIVDQLNTLSEYMERAGLKLDDE
ncbi:hypothetical protein CRV03_03580 [Arcobacter sp. F155]|uniref:hypothetical protein n=1 Tax=Arcobacter sp. F155 TaxID=2044512 RepID=UPI00100AC624|nr:hypothetical protein [Arcobacter sp. F155]RXJ78063.1 hypothetical protein CRV03_03580 [Arcobacter sp. F155]